ncbi:ABC transporter permease [Streptosporangium sp. NBC_01756]|uniref:ABC transporter permease n=1 Tax=Streptosporangium sp. NBC_01756 TaxID=2975950 RepID=UPI002DDA432D|nr:ABC transporter permease [Streptosporangium sp. NBC_01756]WSC84718.1 ABC transporter permease [Streptosporangium sp. NBC_01756]
MRSWKIRIGLLILAFFALMAVVGPLLLTGDPSATGGEALAGPSAEHWLGTTQTGQDILLQVVHGSRVSLGVGVLSAVIATAVSIAVGLVGGYFGGVVDEALSVLTNIFLVLPALPLVIVLAGYLPQRGVASVAVVIAATGWAWGARILRAQTLSIRRRDFVEAARAGGEKPLRIIFYEILPVELPVIATSFLATVVAAILAEAGLSFLGLADLSTVSWGSMLYFAQNGQALLVGAWWWFIPPGLCIALVGAGLGLMNFGIDEIANPRLRTVRAPRRSRRESTAVLETAGEVGP